MRKFLTLSATFLLLAGTAHAGALTSASWVGSFQGTPFTLTTGGGSLIASGSSTATGANVSVTVLSGATFSIVSSGTPQFTITQTLAGAQTLAIAGGGVVANQGIAGHVNEFLFVGVPLLFLEVPLNVGVSGTATFVGTPLLGVRLVTATFIGWQTGFVSISGLFGTTTTVSGASNMTVPLPNFTTQGGSSLTAAGGGTITLVSPTIVTVCSGGTPLCDGSTRDYRIASATRLTLNLVPEASRFLLAGIGGASLVLVGRRFRG